MKKLAFLLSTLVTLNQSPAFAAGASKNASAASEHSVLAVSHATASGAQVASAVVAVPLVAVGSVGSVAMAAGDALLDSVSAKESKPVDRSQPLEISEITITVERTPAQQMAKKPENL